MDRAAVLVIGGTGLMGVPTVRCLLGQGHHVVILTRGKEKGQGTDGCRPKLVEGTDMVVCDRTDAAGFRKYLVDPQCPRIVIDLAAMRPEHVETVLDAHRERPLKHYVFISTNMVYPGGPEGMDISTLPQPVVESMADFSAAAAAPDTYGGRKLKCEALLRSAFESTGFPATVLRPPAVVGPGCDNRHERLQRFLKNLPSLPLRPNAALAAQPGRFRVAYSDDVATAIGAVVEQGNKVHGEAFNIAGEELLTFAEYVATMAEILGDTNVGPPPADPNFRNYERQGAIDISKAQKILGFHSTPIAQWMNITVAWHAQLLAGDAAATL